MIETTRLVLRAPVMDDLAWILAEMNTPEVLRHLAGPRAEADVADGLANDVAAFGSGGHRRWTVWRNADGQRIGRCGLFTIRSPMAPPELRGASEIGWTFAAAAWGQGYASEAARAVIAVFFADAAQSALWSQTSDSNAGSTRMMARLGFARCADFDYVDPDYPAADNPTTVYRLERGAWQP